MKKPQIEAPDFAAIGDLNLPAAQDVIKAEEHKEIVLKPATWKRIPKYSRYEMSSDGQVKNSQTENLVAKEMKGEVEKFRLTADDGKRNWIDLSQVFIDFFQTEVLTGEPAKKSAKLTDKVTLSKSQQIWLAFKASGLEIKDFISKATTDNPDYNAGHIRNLIKDYSVNQEKRDKAAAVAKLIAERDGDKS